MTRAERGIVSSSYRSPPGDMTRIHREFGIVSPFYRSFKTLNPADLGRVSPFIQGTVSDQAVVEPSSKSLANTRSPRAV